MAEIFYSLNKIPDLSLSRYSSLEENGVEGVLKKHLAFLRQINRIGIIARISMHLFYQYDSSLNLGKRLKCMLMFRGEEQALRYIDDILKASPLSEYFSLQKDNTCSLVTRKYPVVSTITKREYFIKSSVGNIARDAEEEFYSINEWKMNEDARLYNMFKLVNSLNKNCLYRVDVYPVDYSERVKNSLDTVMANLRRRTEFRIDKSVGQTSVQRDNNAENVLKRYEELIESVQTNPHFMVNVRAFAEEEQCASIVLDSVCAEALEEGTYKLYTLHGDYAYNSLIGIEQSNISDEKTYFKFKELPCLFELKELAPFFVLPSLYDGETIEIAKETAPKFDYTDDSIVLGVDNNGYNVSFPLKLFAKHAFIAGVPGSGKTNSMLYLTSTLWTKKKVPFLILEPAKQEYRVLSTMPEMENLLVFSPGAGTKFPLHINPFEFPVGMPLAEHIRRLVDVFEGAFPLEPPMPFLLDYSIEAIYRDKGWYPQTINDGKSLQYPTMGELYDRLEKEVENTEYSDEVSGNLKSALQVRIGSLLRREMGDVFNVPSSTLRPEEWLMYPVLIELENMGSGPANFLNLMLSTIIRECLKVNPLGKREMEVRHVIFFEEAHNLIGPEASEVKGDNADPKTAATAFVVKMLAEVRALREGIVIADQLPTAMAPEVIKNTGLKIAHRITSMDDRSLLGGTMSADEGQLEDLALFEPGYALATFEGLLKPFKSRICQWANGELSYDPPNNERLYDIMHKNSYYSFVYRRSWEINRDKFNIEFEAIEKEIAGLLEDNEMVYQECKQLSLKLDENFSGLNWQDIDEDLQSEIQKAMGMKDELAVQFECTMDKMAELRVKIASALNQNVLYSKYYDQCIDIVNEGMKQLAGALQRNKISYPEDKRKKYYDTVLHILEKSELSED